MGPDILDDGCGAEIEALARHVIGAERIWAEEQSRGLEVRTPRRRATVPRTVVPSRKLTEPIGVGPRNFRSLTVAVKVTGRPRFAGLGCAARTVRVGAVPVGVGVGVGVGFGVGVGRRPRSPP